ncbi:MAG: trigger factor [Chloroflexi bacterium]|nr:trigger factor [Chloroflexota bacterium]MCI0648220.1 trigger factor [Chloroflexota bacterium]
MSLTIHTEEDTQRQLKVTIQVPETRVQEAMRRTARELAREVQFPGFRRGKVPYQVLVRRVGEEALRAEAVEGMLQKVLEEALEEIEAEAYLPPRLDHMEMAPLKLELVIPLQPVVRLGDYRSIRKELAPAEVSEEALAEALEHIRTHHQRLEEVDRPVEPGDMATLSGRASLADDEERVIWVEENVQLLMDPTETFIDLPFVENIVGLSAGDEKEFRVTLPEDEDNEELSGKEAVFKVTVLNVQSRSLPELDDELAQQEGDYETLEEMREDIRHNLQTLAASEAKSGLLDDMVKEMLATAELVYPPAAVDEELDDLVEEVKQRASNQGYRWEDYLKLEGLTEEKLREEYRDQAVKRIQERLVLQEFVRQEKLTIGQADVDKALDQRLSRFENEELREQLRKIYSQGDSLRSLTGEILVDKIYERMNAIVSGTAPELAALEEEATDLADSEEEE